MSVTDDATGLEAPVPSTLLDAFDHRVRSDPGSLMVTTFGERGLTYREVAGQVAGLAGELRLLGVTPGSRVAVRTDNRATWIVASLAIWRLGASVVVLGRLLSEAELQRLVRAAGPVLAVGSADDTALPALGIAVVDPAGVAAARDGCADLASPDPVDEACVFCTSGTTGAPKLVVHTHVDLTGVAAQMAEIYPKHPGFRATTAPATAAPGVVFSPYGHVAGYHAWAFRLWIGRPVVLVPRFTVDTLRAVLREYRLDALQLVPAMIYALIDDERPIDLGSVRYVTSGTAPLGEHVRRAFEDRFGIPVLATYGSTEVGPVAHVRFGDVTAGIHPAGSVGRPASDVEVRITDAHGRTLPPGDVGSIEVRRAHTGTYWATTSPPPSDKGFVATGDAGYLDPNGFLFVTGRTNDKLVVGGFNVYPAEIENVATRAPSVRDCLVVGQPDERLGEVPVAGVVWADGPDPDGLRDLLRGELAHYKVPRLFVTLPSLPLTARGKLDRAAGRRAVLAAVGEPPEAPA